MHDPFAIAIGCLTAHPGSTHLFPNFGGLMDSPDPSRGAVPLSAGRINRILQRSPRSGQDRLLPSPVNRKARKREVEPRLIQDAGCAPGLPAHNAAPERGIINTQGQGRAPANNREREDGKGRRGRAARAMGPRPPCRVVTQAMQLGSRGFEGCSRPLQGGGCCGVLGVPQAAR